MTIPEGPGPTIADHVAEVSAKLSRIEKRGTAPASMGSFRFVQVTDVMDALKPELDERGIILRPLVELLRLDLFPRQGKDTPSALAAVSMELWAVMGPDELLLARTVGHGADTQDKAMGKATTSALKQAILIAFAIPTGPDLAPDTERENLDDQQERRPRQARQPAPDTEAAAHAQAAAGAPLPRKAKLIARIAELMREVEQLPAPQNRELNRYSVRQHVRKTHTGMETLSDLFQRGSEEDVEALGRYIAGKLNEVQGMDSSANKPAGETAEAERRAEDMPQDEAMAAGAALAGRKPDPKVTP